MMHVHTDVKALRTAIPYIRAYEGRTFVVKLGGNLCEPGPVLSNIVEQLSLLSTVGIRMVVVHGGGEQVSAMCERLGLRPQLVAGRRITDEPTLDVVKMVLAGVVNTNLVAAFRRFDVPAVGLTGVDGRLITVARRPPRRVLDPSSGVEREVDYGFVGDVVAARMEVLDELLGKRFLPIVCSLAADGAGRMYNVNADTVAARIAVELGAVKYILLTTVDGVMRDVNDHETLQSYLDIEQLDELTKAGVVSGGMLPKLEACADALRGGVPRVHIVNGTVPDTILAEVFTNEGCGTLVVARREAGRPLASEPAAAR